MAKKLEPKDLATSMSSFLSPSELSDKLTSLNGMSDPCDYLDADHLAHQPRPPILVDYVSLTTSLPVATNAIDCRGQHINFISVLGKLKDYPLFVGINTQVTNVGIDTNILLGPLNNRVFNNHSEALPARAVVLPRPQTIVVVRPRDPLEVMHVDLDKHPHSFEVYMKPGEEEGVKKGHSNRHFNKGDDNILHHLGTY
ncbi:hypothetical protein BC827DRAFT_1159517 [Russula dissimulans]|nr:hypothetical protein BC827DRAFT_1159517 [Russula dissimulans]